MSMQSQAASHCRCRVERLEARCLLAVEFIESPQGLGEVDVYTDGVALGDLDGDGDLDAFTVGFPRLWQNNGQGQFRQFGSHGPFSGGSDIALGDLDGDGDLDASFSGHPMLNNGAGRFVLRDQTLGAPFSVLGDLDGDGDLDTIASLIGTHVKFGTWFNDGAGSFPEKESLGFLNDTRDAALADFDDDGDLDVVIAIGADDEAGIWLNDGTGRFGERRSIGNSVVNTVAVGDLDGDEDIDIVLGNTAVLLNDGHANFEDTFQRLGSFSATDIALGDIDLDGDLDALVAEGLSRGTNNIWLNDGEGLFSRVDQNLGEKGGTAVALGDLDGDGDLDAYIGYLGVDRVWFNQAITAQRLTGDANGDGLFNQDDLVQVLQAGKFKTGQPATWSEGDWNGDGFFDQHDLVSALQAGAFTSQAS